MIGFQGDLVIKEENVPETRSEQQENEDHMKTDEIINKVSSLTKQRSHKTSLKLEKHKCDQCEYSCKSTADLERHKLTHTNEKPFIK